MFGGISRRAMPVLSATAVLAAMAIGGCGGDDGGESTAAKDDSKFSAASEPPRAFIERAAKLLETSAKRKDCAQLEEINGRSLARFACPVDKRLRESMASFEVVGAEEYGTGAVVDYRSGKVPDGAAILLFVAPDRNWGISRFGVITDPSTRTGDEESRDGYAEAVDSYLSAVRDRDCEAYRKVAFLEDAKGENPCKTAFEETLGLAKLLKQNPRATPKYEGGNGTYGFFTLETAKPQPANSTISVVRAEEGAEQPYVILNVTPSPTAADQRQIREALKRQQRERKKSQEPSKKPSDPAVKP